MAGKSSGFSERGVPTVSSTRPCGNEINQGAGGFIENAVMASRTWD